MIDPITFWYGMACFAVLGFTFWDRKANPAALQCAIMLFASYVATNLLNAFVPYPDCFKPYAPINLICGAFVSYWVFTRPQIWSLALALTFVVMLWMDTVFAFRGGYTNYGLVGDYSAHQTLLFSFQLLIVLVPGGLNVLGRFGRYLLSNPSWRSLRRFAFWRTERSTEEG